jgi:peroxiredoxin
MNIFQKYKTQIIVFPLLIVLGSLTALVLMKMGFFGVALNDDISETVLINRPLPLLDLVDYKTKAKFGDDLRHGRVLLLYVLTGCRGCQTEADMIVQSSLRKDSNIRVFAVANEDERLIDEFSKSHNLDFPILLDKDGIFRDDFGITFFPSNFLINEGVVEKSWAGTPKSISELKDKLGNVQ